MGFFKKTQDRVRQFRRGYAKRREEQRVKRKAKIQKETEELQTRIKLEESKARLAHAKHKQRKYGGVGLKEKLWETVTEPRKEGPRKFYDPFDNSLWGPTKPTRSKKRKQYDPFEDKGLI